MESMIPTNPVHHQRDGVEDSISWVLGQHHARRSEGQPQVAFIDIDGVLLDNAHRLHYICTPTDGDMPIRHDADWDTFHSQAHLDTPGAFTDMIRVLMTIPSRVIHPIFITARVAIKPETRLEVLEHLSRALKVQVISQELILRAPNPVPKAASEKPPLFKKRVAEMFLRANIKVAFAIDDSHANCMEFKGLGIPTLRAYNHINDGGFKY